MEGPCIGGGLRGRAHHRLTDNLEQGCARPVEVDARAARGQALKALVNRFARVLFEMRTGERNRPGRAIWQNNVHRTPLDHRNLELADLISLGKVWIEVMLSCKDGDRRNRGLHRQAESNGSSHGCAIHHGQHPRQGEVHRMGLGVGLRPEGRGRRRKNFRLRL